MIGALFFYNLGWFRYIQKGQTEEWLYRPMAGVILPMVIMPILYFFLASCLLETIWLFFAVILFAAGHLAVSIVRYRDLKKFFAI